MGCYLNIKLKLHKQESEKLSVIHVYLLGILVMLSKSSQKCKIWGIVLAVFNYADILCKHITNGDRLIRWAAHG